MRKRLYVIPQIRTYTSKSMPILAIGSTRGERITNDRGKKHCGKKSQNTALFPRSHYYREWLSERESSSTLHCRHFAAANGLGKETIEEIRNLRLTAIWEKNGKEEEEEKSFAQQKRRGKIIYEFFLLLLLSPQMIFSPELLCKIHFCGPVSTGYVHWF